MAETHDLIQIKAVKLIHRTSDLKCKCKWILNWNNKNKKQTLFLKYPLHSVYNFQVPVQPTAADLEEEKLRKKLNELTGNISDKGLSSDEDEYKTFDYDPPRKVESPHKVESPRRAESPRRMESPRKVESPRKMESARKSESPKKVESPRKNGSPRKNESPHKTEPFKVNCMSAIGAKHTSSKWQPRQLHTAAFNIFGNFLKNQHPTIVFFSVNLSS